MPIETRSNGALFRRAEQLKRWEDSETNQVSPTISQDKKSKIKFSDGCVFLAACAASDTDEVERLIKLGTDINTANVDGLTALHQACIDNNLEMVQFLVELGCDVNRGDNEGWTPLHATASCGFLSIAKYLIENKANVAAVNNDGDLPIDIAESSEMEEYLSDVLDEQRIDCDFARSEEERLMMEDVKAFLSSGADLYDKIHPRTAATPLHVAASKGYIDVMKLLIQGGVDLNAQDNDGWTPLHAAAHWGQKEACAILADSLVNMDIQNLAGQTCFDVAEPELVKLLEELKKKQTHLQKDRPDIQAILQRTSDRPPLKRRTSVTRMSGHEKSKSVMKDTKAERAQIENLSLQEEENEDDKDKKPAEVVKQPTDTLEEAYKMAELKKDVKIDLPAEQPKNVPSFESKSTVSETSAAKEPQLERIPSWKKVLRRSSEEKEAEIAEITLKRPKKTNEDSDKSVRSQESGDINKDGRAMLAQVRDDESELQRKAHAKRVRETRRSTQGVLLEDIKSAELQYLINTQQEAAKRQAEEAQDEGLGSGSSTASELSAKIIQSPPVDLASKDNSLWRSRKNLTNDTKDTNNEQISRSTKATKETNKSDEETKAADCPSSTDIPPSVTLVLRSKPTSSPEDISPSDSRASLGTQAAIQRRRRPKRRSTGVVYLDSDDAQEEKENTGDKDSQAEAGQTERFRQKYGSSSSIPDTASESSRSDTSGRYGSSSRINEEENRDFKKLYEETKKENERLKEALKKSDEDLEKAKRQLDKSIKNNTIKGSLSETEKKERRSLERKISEMEEEIKQIEKLKADNERLSNENKALIRVISKLSK